MKLKALMKKTSKANVWCGDHRVGEFNYGENSYPVKMQMYLDYYVEWIDMGSLRVDVVRNKIEEDK